MSRCSRAEEGHIYGLFHETSLENIGKILRSGVLYTGAEYGTKFPDQSLVGLITSKGEEWKEGGQYNGVYFRPFFDFFVDTPLLAKKKSKYPTPFRDSKQFPTKYVLVFSTVLLERNDYHVNLNDQNGFITADSYRPSEMKEVGLHRADHPKTFAEVVFHRQVPAPYLQEIWVLGKDEKEFEARRADIEKELKGTGYETLIQSKYRTTFPNQMYNCGCDEAKLVTALQASGAPNFCTAWPNEIPESINPLMIATKEKYMQIAKDCGIDDATIQSLAAKPDQTYRALRDAIHEKEVARTVEMIQSNRNSRRRQRVWMKKGVYKGQSGTLVSETRKKVIVELRKGVRVQVLKTSVAF